MYDTIIKNGIVYDGSGAPGNRFDMAVSGGRIAAIAPEIKTAARTVIDASDRVVSPGFIDIQNHSDVYWQLTEHPSLSSLTTQGYTLIVVGNCGASIAPLANENAIKPMQKWRGLSGLNADWRSVEELAKRLNSTGLGANVYTLIGYETLRRSLVGDETRSLSVDERRSIIRSLGASLRAGARGVSFGLAYAHEETALEQELRDVCELVASHHGLVSVHLRSEGSHVIDALHEAIHLAEQTGARIKISHFKIRGQRNWPLLDQALGIIERAQHRHININFDFYPYASTWQVLYNYLPAWATAGGREHMLHELRDVTQRRKISDYLRDYNLQVGELILASSSNNLPGVGKRIGEIARGLEASSEETVLYLLEHGGSEVMVFDHNINPDSLVALIKHPLSIIATDGAGFPLPSDQTFNTIRHKLVHSRCYGTAPTFLRTVLDRKLIPLEATIHKLTGRPAAILGAANRGVLKVGAEADITIFDPDRISSSATLANPSQQAKGIEDVLVHGVPVVTLGHVQPVRPGRFITA